MRARHQLSLRLLVAAVAALLCAAAPQASHAATNCPLPQPKFAYVDTDNDGCHTPGVDSASVDADLAAASFVGPPGTGLVIPHSLSLPFQANPHWSIENDVWIDGRVGGPSELIIEAGGTTYVNGVIKLQAYGDGYEGDMLIGCATGCGPVVIADGARVEANGYVTIYDAAIGDDVRMAFPCSPSSEFTCDSYIELFRTVSIGDRLRVRAPGGITIHGGSAPLVVGDELKMRTIAQFVDGGTVSYDIEILAAAGLTIGERANLHAGGTLQLGAVSAGVPSAPFELGQSAKLAGTGWAGVRLWGSTIGIGSAGKIRANYEIDSNKVMPVTLRGAGAVDVAERVRIIGGEMLIDAGTGALTLAPEVFVTAQDRVQAIRLQGGSVNVGAGCKLVKSNQDGSPVRVVATSGATISSSLLHGAGLEVSVTDPGAAIEFTSNGAKGSLGTAAVFSAPSGSCDLSGSTFTNLALDVAACGSVTGP
jgi:hypothetical protein